MDARSHITQDSEKKTSTDSKDLLKHAIISGASLEDIQRLVEIGGCALTWSDDSDPLSYHDSLGFFIDYKEIYEALPLAIKCQRLDVMAWLIEEKQCPLQYKLRHSTCGENALHTALRTHLKKENLNIVEWLISKSYYTHDAILNVCTGSKNISYENFLTCFEEYFEEWVKLKDINKALHYSQEIYEEYQLQATYWKQKFEKDKKPLTESIYHRHAAMQKRAGDLIDKAKQHISFDFAFSAQQDPAPKTFNDLRDDYLIKIHSHLSIRETEKERIALATLLLDEKTALQEANNTFQWLHSQKPLVLKAIQAYYYLRECKSSEALNLLSQVHRILSGKHKQSTHLHPKHHYDIHTWLPKNFNAAFLYCFSKDKPDNLKEILQSSLIVELSRRLEASSQAPGNSLQSLPERKTSKPKLSTTILEVCLPEAKNRFFAAIDGKTPDEIRDHCLKNLVFDPLELARTTLANLILEGKIQLKGKSSPLNFIPQQHAEMKQAIQAYYFLKQCKGHEALRLLSQVQSALSADHCTQGIKIEDWTTEALQFSLLFHHYKLEKFYSGYSAESAQMETFAKHIFKHKTKHTPTLFQLVGDMPNATPEANVQMSLGKK